jgi:hypothetical protein
VGRTEPARAQVAPGSLPIWSCSVWGLPCLPHCCSSGALLPHLFTLTLLQAVCFLWHFPWGRLESALPDVIRHTALWSSDFPLRVLDERERPSGPAANLFIIVDVGKPSLVVRRSSLAELSPVGKATPVRLSLLSRALACERPTNDVRRESRDYPRSHPHCASVIVGQ